MPQVTKAMLEERAQRYARLVETQDNKIKYLEEKIKLLNSPMSGPGQLTVQLITIQRLSEALSHVIEEVRKPAPRPQLTQSHHQKQN